MAAMSMHPDNRPASVEDFADMLLSSHDVVITGDVYSVAKQSWLEAIRSNTALAAIAAVLVLLAFVISISNSLT
jgi:hypothetical protein